jgi:rod shape-determining protein MreD
LTDSILFRVSMVMVVAAILQYAVFSTIRVAGVAPDVLLVVAIGAGLVAGARRGAIAGFSAGVAMDLIMPGRPFGLSVLTFTLVGYTVGRYQSVGRSQYASATQSRAAAVGIAGAASALAAGGYVLFARVFDGVDLLGGRFVAIAAMLAVWSMVLITPVNAVMRWAWRQPARVSSWSR